MRSARLPRKVLSAFFSSVFPCAILTWRKPSCRPGCGGRRRDASRLRMHYIIFSAFCARRIRKKTRSPAPSAVAEKEVFHGLGGRVGFVALRAAVFLRRRALRVVQSKPAASTGIVPAVSKALPRPCAGVLFAHVRAVDEKDIRLFSAGGKRRQNHRKLEERCRDAAANLPRKRDVNLSHCGNAIRRMWSPFGWVRNGVVAKRRARA